MGGKGVEQLVDWAVSLTVAVLQIAVLGYTQEHYQLGPLGVAFACYCRRRLGRPREPICSHRCRMTTSAVDWSVLRACLYAWTLVYS